ncbi:MAG: FecR domain-containing protein [Prevotellaceae bacterium]|jgi:ferric-dicitrate binding protein FerR (iron transport regulator)|nr:FecR domain-containing protein [Prevotellaceae bacterium]
MSQDIDRIIARRLGGNATPEEQRLLQAWLAESEQNRTFFAAVVSGAKPDAERGWKKLERHIRQSVAATRPPQAATWRLALRYAAVVALLVGVAAVAWTRLGGGGGDNNSSSSDGGVSVSVSQQAWVVAESRDATYTYTLSDSGSVLLNRGSKLSCIGDCGRRELQLEGEAFFEVAASGSGQLVVHAEETLIRDVGTAFNVQAYPGDSSVTVFVQSGEVHFYTAEDSGGLTLRAGETGVFDRRTKTFGYGQTDVNATAYATGTLVFRDRPLGEAVATINRVCNVHIRVDDPAAAAQTISVTFDGETVEEMVEVIGETMHLQVAAQGNGEYLLTP